MGPQWQTKNSNKKIKVSDKSITPYADNSLEETPRMNG